MRLATSSGYTFPSSPGVSLESVLPNCCPDGIQLLSEMLRFDPAKRPSAQQILASPYFSGEIDFDPPKRHFYMEEQKSESMPVMIPRNKMQDTSQKFMEFLD